MTKRTNLLILLDMLPTLDTDECVRPPGKPHKTTGYGHVKANKRGVGAHVVACGWAHGEPPTSRHEVAHSCGKRFCVNPRHLRWATRAENFADKLIHGTTFHPRGELQGKHKLTWANVALIRQRLAKGERGCDLAVEYGVSRASISLIRSGVTWQVV